jgi:hypothetical protein
LVADLLRALAPLGRLGLNELDASGNNFTGRLPQDLAKYLPNVAYLHLGSNPYLHHRRAAQQGHV